MPLITESYMPPTYPKTEENMPRCNNVRGFVCPDNLWATISKVAETEETSASELVRRFLRWALREWQAGERPGPRKAA